MKMLYPWLSGYFGIGVAVFLGYYLYNHRPWKNKRRGKMRELIRNFNKKPRSDKLIESAVFVIGTVLALGCWPVFVGMAEGEKLIQKIQKIRKARSKPKFAANKGNLKTRMEVCEIETVEVVSDPLNAAPNLPFGHLNSAWEAFKGKRIEGDAIWSFSTDMVAESKPRPIRRDQLFEGYGAAHR